MTTGLRKTETSVGTCFKTSASSVLHRRSAPEKDTKAKNVARVTRGVMDHAKNTPGIREEECRRSRVDADSTGRFEECAGRVGPRRRHIIPSSPPFNRKLASRFSFTVMTTLRPSCLMSTPSIIFRLSAVLLYHTLPPPTPRAWRRGRAARGWWALPPCKMIFFGLEDSLAITRRDPVTASELRRVEGSSLDRPSLNCRVRVMLSGGNRKHHSNGFIWMDFWGLGSYDDAYRRVDRCSQAQA